MIELMTISKEYRVKKRVIEALKPLSVIFPDTGLYTVCGKSGAGKTTLLHILGLIEKPTTGTLLYNGRPIPKLNGRVADVYRERVSFVFQDYELLQESDVFDNVALPIRTRGYAREDVAERVVSALEIVGLAGYGNRRISQLSGGEQQRVVIARAIVCDSSVVLCDEPTGNLDGETAEGIFQLLKRLSRERLVITVTHDAVLAEKYTDGMMKVEDGVCVQQTVSPSPTGRNAGVLPKTPKKSRFRSFACLLRLGVAALKRMKVTAVLGFLTAAICLSVFNLFFSFSGYDSARALSETLRKNNQYILQVTQCRVRPFFGSTGTRNGGFRYSPQDLKESDIDDIYRQTGESVAYYPSYYYTVSFNAFTDSFIPGQGCGTSRFRFRQIVFKEIIAVENFETFRQPLLSGTVPSAKNEIMIYDYMADNLLYYGVIEGSRVEDAVGAVLTNKETGDTYIISGVLPSRYLQYSYIEANDERYVYEETYLYSLQCIFAYPDVLDSLPRDVVAVNYVLGLPASDSEEYCDLKISSVRDIEDVDKSKLWLEIYPEYDRPAGVILTKQQLFYFAGKELTKEEALAFLSTFEVEVGWYIFSGDLDGGIARERMLVFAVAEDGYLDECVLSARGADSIPFGETSPVNGEFRQYYLSLSDDWEENMRVLEKLKFPKNETEEYYSNLKEEEKVRYCDYTPYTAILQEADAYMKSIGVFSSDILYILLPAIIALLFFFVYYATKANGYVIGLYKALGMRDCSIASVFVVAVMLIVLLGLLAAIPLSVLFLNFVNSGFAEAVGDFNLYFFSLGNGWLFKELFVMIAATAAVSLLTYIIMTVKPPVHLIRENKNR